MIPNHRGFSLAAAIAAVVAVGTLGCATDYTAPGPPSADQDLRVDVQWRQEIATDRMWEVEPRELGRPVMAAAGDLAVGATNGWVYRVESQSGQIRWGQPVGGSVDAAVHHQGGNVYVGTDAAELVVLDWRSGDEQWRFETRGSLEATPTVAGGRVFATDSEDRLYAIDADSGELLWDFQHEAPEFFTIKGGGEPLVVGNVVYCGFANGQLTALNAADGTEIWSVYLGDEEGEFADVDLPLFEYGDQLIATSHAGGIYGVERETGALLWHVDVGDVAGVAMEQNWLFAATATGRILAVETGEAEIAWEYELPDQQMATDVGIAGRYLAVSVSDGPMHWLRADNGALAAKWAPSNGFQHAPVFDGQAGYVMSNRGYLYGFTVAY